MKPRAALFNQHLYLWILFSVICFSLGYATLNRYDPSQTRGVGDSKYYFQMVRFDYSEVASPHRFRILTPTLAGLLTPALSRLPHHSWNLTSLALLVINSLFVSLSAILLFQQTARMGGSASTALIAAFLYLTAFPIPNGHLAGLVDAGEGFVVLAVLRALTCSQPTLCIGILVLSAMAKETALLFCSVLLVTWWFASPKEASSARSIPLHWILASIAAGVLTLCLVRLAIGGPAYSRHDLSAARLIGLGQNLLLCLTSRTILYTFFFLLPAGVVGLKDIPRPFLSASVAAGLVACLAGAYAGITDNLARPLFNTVGPLLCIASALSLSRWVLKGPVTAPSDQTSAR